MWRNIFTGKERRQYVRLNTELDVDFTLNGEAGEISAHKGKTEDISLEGICLATDIFTKGQWESVARENKHLRLCIYFPGYKDEKVRADAEVQSIAVEAEVVWQHVKKGGEKDMCSLGLHFTNIEKSGQELIRRFIADSLIKRYESV